MTYAEIIQLERQIAEDTEATQIRLSTQYCPACGTRKIRGKCEYCDESNSQSTLQIVKDFSMDEIAEIPY